MDPRAVHLRRLSRLRRSVRGWAVRAGLLTGAAAVLAPYQGLGLPDVAWAAAAGGSLALVAIRAVELRAFAQLPIPPAMTPEEAAAASRQRLLSAIRRVPGGDLAVDGIRRQWDLHRVRGTAVAELWRRLEQASATMAGLRSRIAGPAATTLLDTPGAERSLRSLAERALSVEKAAAALPASSGRPLADASVALHGQLADGVAAYEQLVAAAAAYVAEDTRTPGVDPAITGLADAAELLRCVAASMSDLRNSQTRRVPDLGGGPQPLRDPRMPAGG